MKKLIAAALGLAALPLLPAAAQDAPKEMRAAAADSIAWDIVVGLTTEVGPRLAGTEAEERARRWAAAKMRALGLQNVRIENFAMPVWRRGAEKAAVVSPFPQPLVVTALGNSGSTGKAGVTGELAYFPSYQALIEAPESAVRGRVVLLDHAMKVTQDGSGYGLAGPARWNGPNAAAKKGALAFLVRSIGTDSHRMPHAGNTTFEDGVAPIPAAALSTPDADNLRRMISRADGPVRLSLTLTPTRDPDGRSGNVIGEIAGRDPTLPIVLVACHLDSWDLGTGAVDNASGCGIVTAAAIHAAADAQPLRTIRILWAGAEEVGAHGGADYAKRHGDEPHALAMESDFGAGEIWRAELGLAEEADQLGLALAGALAPLGVSVDPGEPRGGADIRAVAQQTNAAMIDLTQDGRDYFVLHHSADDTLDKVDPAAVRQNVQAWTAVLMLTANHARPIAPSPAE